MKKLNITIILILFCQFVFAQKDLKLNLELGKVYTQEFTSKMDLEQKIMGMNVNANIDLSQNLSFKPIDFKNKLYTLEVAFENMVMRTKTQGMDIDMDGSGDQSNPMNKIFGNLLHKPFQIIMSSKGEIKEIKGLDELFMKVTDSLEITDVQKEMIRKNILKNLNAESLNNQINTAGFKYPEQKVKVGDSWSNDFTTSGNGINMSLTSTFIVKEITDEYIVCSFTTKSKYQEGSDQPTEFYSGEIKLDAKSGWVISNHGNQTLKGKFSIPNPMDENAGEIEFYLDMKGTYQVNGSKL